MKCKKLIYYNEHSLKLKEAVAYLIYSWNGIYHG